MIKFALFILERVRLFGFEVISSSLKREFQFDNTFYSNRANILEFSNCDFKYSKPHELFRLPNRKRATIVCAFLEFSTYDKTYRRSER